MVRHCFFSFRYAHVWRVNQIRSMKHVLSSATAGFRDSSLWEDAKENGPKIKKMIDDNLFGTSVTIVCITYGISTRKWINYEINQSIERRNGLLGLQLHHLKDPISPDDRVGRTPRQIEDNGFKVYKYKNKERLAAWIEEAAKLAGR